LPRFVPGLGLAFALALAATLLADTATASTLGLSALTLAIVLGMAVGNTFYPRLEGLADAGVDLARQRLLRLGIVLFGLRITFQDIAALGWAGVGIDALMLGSTFGLALLAGRRWLRLDAQAVVLIGAGSSICGAAAVLATAPVVKADADHVAVAVATVVVFGTLAMFAYPLLLPLLQSASVGDAAYGLFVGSTIHEVAQVVVAGGAAGESAAGQAVIAKMIRVMMLAPFLLALSAFWSRTGNAGASGPRSWNVTVPWFALGFLAVAGIHSLGMLPETLVRALVLLDGFLLAMAMAALGLTTRVSAVRRAGRRPLLLAALLFGWLVLGGALVNATVGGWWR
jgi:uncharacterized integral membrane protein (TIGR00698 family)